MGKENIRDILSKTQAGVSRIEENARKRVGGHLWNNMKRIKSVV